ncbi:JmjC domain-containing protein 4 [Podila humilis]|nr:JmjC domain-containing protein 4 [Podila humilis]
MAPPLPHIHAPRDYSHLVEIPYSENPPSYAEFLERYLEPNIPVLIGPTLTRSWRASQDWVAADGKPNFDLLRRQLCSQPVQVPVADCHSKDFSDQKRSSMDLKDFLDEWQAQSEANVPARTYLKDFHFVRTFPNYGAYQTPDIFRDDWMNEFWTRRKATDDDGGDDYRFVSYSWSANICGIKKWTLFPPGQEHLFQDTLHNSVYDIDNPENIKQFPNFDKAIKFELFQNPGETLFVPSGWWHQVQNIGDTISINHNWCNGSNLDLLLDSITSDLKDVERSIAHLEEMMSGNEWVETCQNLLLLNSGWDWATLWDMCTTVRERVINQKQHGEVTPLPPPLESKTTCSTSARFSEGRAVVVPKPGAIPLFPPPLLTQQPDLDVTLGRLDAVLGYIKSIPSARWFLTHVKQIKID